MLININTSYTLMIGWKQNIMIMMFIYFQVAIVKFIKVVGIFFGIKNKLSIPTSPRKSSRDMKEIVLRLIIIAIIVMHLC